MNCPKCEGECVRDEVDVAVGIIYGPWGCYSCGWSEDPRYDRSEGPSPEQIKAGNSRYVDPCGGIQSVDRIVEGCQRFGIPESLVRDAFDN